MKGFVRCSWLIVVAIAPLTVAAAECVAADGLNDLSVFVKPAPDTLDDLQAVEEAARRVAVKVIPCTVGLRVGGAQGSGVIVSKDGYVLTAAHVIGRPGREAHIQLPDGRVAKGKTLGVNMDADGGLVKITDDGVWPYASVVSGDEGPQPGDWCLAAGHPGGFEKGRAPPLRLGRVIELDGHVMRSDCIITSGDSGGPLFDMKGRVIGIHSRITEESTVNLHGPALAYTQIWERLVAGEIYPPTPHSRFIDRLDVDRDGIVTRAELPKGTYRRVFDRMARTFDLDAKKPYTIEEFKKAIRWRATASSTMTRLAIRPYRPGEQRDNSLPRERFVRGPEVRKVFDRLVAETVKSTVEVECGGKRVALGTVVNSDGWVLTKASQLTDEITCKLHDGGEFSAQVVSVDRSCDLALLRFAAKDLNVVEWSDSSELHPGSWLATPDTKGAACVGIVSVAERKIAGTPGVLGVEVANEGKSTLIARVFPRSGAAKGGLRPKDVIARIMDQPVSNLEELRKALQKHHAGEVVKATIVRGDEKLEIDVTLGMPQETFFGSGRNRLLGPLSRRRDDFPMAIQHDSVLRPTDCGGPIVDLSGKVVGVNVARTERTVTYAVPSRIIQPLVDRLMAEAAAQTE